MFQSAGLFRDVSCPYYIFGLCERPYCHFKHSKHDGAKGIHFVLKKKKIIIKVYFIIAQSLAIFGLIWKTLVVIFHLMHFTC